MNDRRVQLIPLLPMWLLLIADLPLVALGLYVWRFQQRVTLADPTSYHVNNILSVLMLGPALMGFAILAFWIPRQLILRIQETGRKQTDPPGYE